MTPEELQAIKDRLAKATPGPWLFDYEVYKHFTVFDTDLILHAPNDLAALIAEVERLQEYTKRRPRPTTRFLKERAQVLDATSGGNGKITFPRKGYDLAGPENHHFLRPGRTP